MSAPSTIERAQAALAALPPASEWILAFSGGLDSTALLHLLHQTPNRPPLRAAHVDHGLHPDSHCWAEHCRAHCGALDIPFECVRVQLDPTVGASVEAVAREHRYAALRRYAHKTAIVFTAHHAEDQSETLLLNLLRGAGPAGLAAMPRLARFGEGRLARPLLDTPRAALRALAQTQGLTWLDDPSNDDCRYDRNYLRNRILPGLRTRWPGLDGVLGRTAGLQAETTRLLEELAELDLAALNPGADHSLSQARLLTLSPARQANALRLWIQRRGFRTPPQRRINALLTQLAAAAADRITQTQWSGCIVNGWRGRLYIRAQTPEIDQCLHQPVRPGEPCGLRDGNGRLIWREQTPGLDPARLAVQEIGLRYRRGGERLRLRADGPNRELKKLYQERGVPPWERQRRPLLWVGETLIAVPGLFLNADWAKAAECPGLWPEWTPENGD